MENLCENIHTSEDLNKRTDVRNFQLITVLQNVLLSMPCSDMVVCICGAACRFQTLQAIARHLDLYRCQTVQEHVVVSLGFIPLRPGF